MEPGQAKAGLDGLILEVERCCTGRRGITKIDLI